MTDARTLPHLPGAGSAGPSRGYLDHACVGPPSRRTLQAVSNALAVLAAPIDDATAASVRWLDQTERTRRVVADLFGAPPADVSLVQNTTDGLTTVLTAFPWQPGDALIVADREFMGAATVCRSLARARSLELRVADGPRADQVAGCLDTRVRVVVMSSVAEVSGVRPDLHAVAEACASVGAMLVVDGAQEAGVLVRDLPTCGTDAYSSGAHKWLRSPFGIGVLWTSAQLRERLVPGARGYLALSDPPGGWGTYLARADRDATDELPFRADGVALESGGVPNWVGATALAAAVGELLDAGPALIERRAMELAERLRIGLAERGFGDSFLDPVGTSPLVSLAIDRNADDVAPSFAQRGVHVSIRGALGDRALRVSCHGWNQPDDVDLFLEAVDDGVVPLVPATWTARRR